MSPGWRFPELLLSYRKMPIFPICFMAAAIAVADPTPSPHAALRLTLRPPCDFIITIHYSLLNVQVTACPPERFGVVALCVGWVLRVEGRCHSPALIPNLRRNATHETVAMPGGDFPVLLMCHTGVASAERGDAGCCCLFVFCGGGGAQDADENRSRGTQR